MTKSTFKDWMNKSGLNESKCKCDCGKVPCVECGGDHHKKEMKEESEAQKCGKGKYWCFTDKKCKKIPTGYHVMGSGRLMKDENHEDGEEKKNGNGGSNGNGDGGGVSESSCGSMSKKKRKKLSEMISTSSTGGKYKDISGREEQENLAKERSKRKKERSEKYKAHLEKLRGETREKGVRFYDKKGSGYIRDGKKVYDESVNLDEKCWKGYEKKGMKTMFGKRYPNCVKKEETEIEEKAMSCWKTHKKVGMKMKGGKLVNDCRPKNEEFSDWRKEIQEGNKSGDSSLRDWFSKSRSSDGTPGWVQLGGKYAGKPCAKQPGQTTKPKCGSSKMKADLSKEEEERAFRRKNRQDPNPDRKGKAKNVATEETTLESYTIDAKTHKMQQKREKIRNLASRGEGGEKDVAKRKLGKVAELPSLKREESEKDHEFEMARRQLATVKHASDRLKKKMGKKGEGQLKAWVQSKLTRAADDIDTVADYVTNEAAGEKDACYHKVKSRYSVWPSAYASGALVKCRKKGAKNWGNKTKKEGYEFSNWRDDFKATEYETIDIVKPEPMIGLSEDVEKLQSTGNVFSIMLMWRGKTYRLQLFFPGPKRPSREEVKTEIQKFYPGGILTHYYPSPSDPSQPIVVIQR